MKKIAIPLICLSGLCVCLTSALAAEKKTTQPDDLDQLIQELKEINVISSTPLQGSETTKNKIAAPVQTATDKDINKTNAVNLTDYMNRGLGSVFINETQGNPFQPDVNYRGYTASPLLGTPQGLSVYMDGVRLNQPFGDVVSWDLIPKSAISSLTMMPGSNPLFGRNTLGGALSLQTKDGKHNAGTSVQGLGGAYGRYAFEFEHGGYNNSGLNWYVTGNYFNEDGWRASSPSNVRQIFGKVGWENAQTAVKFTTAFADNELLGNGLQEKKFIVNQYNSVYTKPDVTDNRSLFLNLEGKHEINKNIVLSGNSYYRNIRTSTYNGDINEGSLNQATYGLSAGDQALLTNAGIAYPPFALDNTNTRFPYLKCVANALAGAADIMDGEAGEKCNGLINRTRTNQENWGTAGQIALNYDIFKFKNHFLFGGAYDESIAGFKQTTQIGFLNPDRSITPLPFYADGVTGGNVNLAPFDNRVSLKGNTRTWSFYLEDTLSLRDDLHITASGRYNYTTVNNRDLITPEGVAGSLSGRHSFERFNPAVGIAYNPMKELNFYAGYNEGSRAPTTIELGCADPNNPCKLPNSMAGDPPLKQVVTRTWEVGFRGQAPWQIDWHIGYFHAENKNDIMFVADNQAGFGYFKNFGKTQRQGLEISLDRKVDDLSIGANYTFLDATYQSNELVNGTSNSTAALSADAGDVAGVIMIKPGNKIPLTPAHSFKTYIDYQLSKDWGTNLNVMGFSSAYARGNENNAHQADGVRYLGSGKSPGYVILNYGLRFTPSFVPGLQVFGQINNLLDKQYYSGAQLGPTGFDANGNFTARPFGGSATAGYPSAQATFYSPGAPRTFWLGLKYSF